MSSTTGFGGNGNANRSEYIPPTDQTVSCVDSGPFKDLRPEYLANSPTEITEGGHCFFRSVAEANEPEAWATMKDTLTPEYVANQQKLETFAKFAPNLEASPHGTIHASLGGEMNPTTSPNGEYTCAYNTLLSAQATNGTSRATFLPSPPTSRSSVVELAAAGSGEACNRLQWHASALGKHKLHSSVFERYTEHVGRCRRCAGQRCHEHHRPSVVLPVLIAICSTQEERDIIITYAVGSSNRAKYLE